MQEVPQVVANCKILNKLGQGGMGSVYRSVHLTLGRKMAIKILPTEFTSSPEYITRFLREARAIAALHHGNIVLVHDAGEQRGLYYIAMELVDGASLSLITRHCTKLPEVVALDFLRQAAKGLGYAHEQGMVHRDIKPENLLVNREGTLKVVDFGLVLESSSQSHLTRTGTFLGTPTFMSPEQCDGDVADARSDLYSLGATFYTILTGRAPFTGTSALGIMYKHKFNPPPPLDPDISARTSSIILKLLEKKREDRYQKAEELVAAVSEALQALPPDKEWSLDKVLTTVAPPLPEPTAEDLTLKPADSGSETITMRGAPRGRSAGPVKDYPSAGPAEASSSVVGQQKAAWDPTVIGNRTPPPPGATPAPAPVPGTATPAPVPRPTRVGLWLGLAAVILVALGAGGFLLYQHNRKAALERHVLKIEGLRQQGDLIEAKAQLLFAMNSFPNEPKLSAMELELDEALKRKEEADLARTRREVSKEVRKEIKLEGLQRKAETAAGNENYDEALRYLEEALKLGINTENTQAGIRSVKFRKLTSLASKAERDEEWADALVLARQALEFGSAEQLVYQLEQRVKLENLRSEARRLLGEKDLLAAAQKYEAAAGFALQNETLQQELQNAALQQRLKHHLNMATEAEKNGAWNSAITALTTASELKPDDEDIKTRLASARTTLRKRTDYDSSMKSGRDAMKTQNWAEAAEMFRNALGHRANSQEAKVLLAESENRVLVARTQTLVQAKSWSSAKALLDGAKTSFAEAPQSDLKKTYADLGKQIQAQLDAISQKEKLAAKAAKEGSFESAISGYQALAELNPGNRLTYQNKVWTLRREQAFQERLAAGDKLTASGQFKEAKTSYIQAREKRDDEEALAMVDRRLVLLAGTEKLAGAETLVKDKDWLTARTKLLEIQKALPADAQELTTRLSAQLEGVDSALASIASLEKTSESAEKDRKWDKGRKALEQLIELNPTQKEQYQQQLDALENAFKAYNDQAARKKRYDGHIAEAQKQLAGGHEAEAITAAEAALAAMPNDATATKLLADARRRQATKIAEKALSQTHEAVSGLLDRNQLDQALATAQTAAKQHPTVTTFEGITSALNAIRNAKQVVSKSRKCLDGTTQVLAGAPKEAHAQRKTVDALHQRLNENEAGVLGSFKEGNYAIAQESARQLAANTYPQVTATLNAIAADLDKKGEEAAKGSPRRRRYHGVGEGDVEDQRKGDPQKAAALRKAAQDIRDLAAKLR